MCLKNKSSSRRDKKDGTKSLRMLIFAQKETSVGLIQNLVINNQLKFKEPQLRKFFDDSIPMLNSMGWWASDQPMHDGSHSCTGSTDKIGTVSWTAGRYTDKNRNKIGKI